MSTEREALLTRMIHIYGFEHPLTIQFACACESYPTYPTYPDWDAILRTLVECHEATPYREEENA